MGLARDEMEGKCELQKQEVVRRLANNNEEDFSNKYDKNNALTVSMNCSIEPTRSSSSTSNNESVISVSSGSFGNNSDEEETSSQADSATTGEEVNCSSSGRSSANTELVEEFKVLNPHSNLIPEVSSSSELVDQVRVRFLSSLTSDENDSSEYDSLDLEELKKDLPAINELEQSLAFRLISRYLNFQLLSLESEGEICEAVERLKELLKFRKQYQLTRVLPEQFSKQFYILSGAFQFGHDRQNVPILYLRARVHRKWSTGLDESFRRYVAWQVDQITKSWSGAKVSKTTGLSGLEKDGSFGICFDCANVGYACVDMEFLRFLVRLLVQFYPTYCRYALCVDLPWLFRSVWKLVRSWLPEDARNTVQLITSKQLTEFIDEDQIPNCMRTMNATMTKSSGKPIEGKHKLPKKWNSIKDIEEFAEELKLSSSEIKQFKTHADKVLKEYEQLGAL